MMECVSIDSRLIASAAYYRRDRKLCVWFNSGRCAWHDDISEAMFRNLAKAESAGFYYSNYIAKLRRKGAQKGGAHARLALFAVVLLALVGVTNSISDPKAGEAPMSRYGTDYQQIIGAR
jgi:hypothetical protein